LDSNPGVAIVRSNECPRRWDHWTSGVSDRLIRESTTTSRVRSVFGNACGQTVG